MIDRFEELIKELGMNINVPTLAPDKHRICRLNINNILHIQIEPDQSRERVLLATFICDLPPGKFREKTLKEALKANGEVPSSGYLGFCERTDKLSLHHHLALYNLNGERLASHLAKFIEKADSWRVAIETGSPLPSASPPFPFSGVKR
jgi:hypothetical protein